jgi:hypothetical protein
MVAAAFWAIKINRTRDTWVGTERNWRHGREILPGIPATHKRRGCATGRSDPYQGRSYPRAVFLKSNSSRTCISSRSAMRSSTSKPGELIPRSIRLRKSTPMPTSSANSSCVSLRFSRMAFSRFPKSAGVWASLGRLIVHPSDLELPVEGGDLVLR